MDTYEKNKGFNIISPPKLKLKLVDATTLWVREISVNEQLVAYSYYWLRGNNTVIIGWDNAQHHPEVSTYPHHRHIGNKIESSEQKNLQDVLIFIRDIFNK